MFKVLVLLFALDGSLIEYLESQPAYYLPTMEACNADLAADAEEDVFDEMQDEYGAAKMTVQCVSSSHNAARTGV
jgi:hypothetical protein